MPLESAILFETPVEMYTRVFREMRPHGAAPEIVVDFRRFANANSFIRMRDGRVEVRITDLLQGAPAPILEALAYILVSKLLRRPVPAAHARRYRLYLNRKEMRRSLHLLRQTRGRKYISGPRGEFYNLDEVFERLNRQYFNGLLGRPLLGWSRRPSRTTLGHYDPSHNAIVVSRLLDSPAVPAHALDYVVFHEMLHLRYPVEHSGIRRTVHTAEFREAERNFPKRKEAKEALRRLR